MYQLFFSRNSNKAQSIPERRHKLRYNYIQKDIMNNIMKY